MRIFIQQARDSGRYSGSLHGSSSVPSSSNRMFLLFAVIPNGCHSLAERDVIDAPAAIFPLQPVGYRRLEVGAGVISNG